MSFAPDRPVQGGGHPPPRRSPGRRARWAAGALSGALLFCLTGPASLAGTDRHCDPGALEAGGVRSVAEGIIEADNARDIDRVLGYYAAGAVLMPPGEDPVTGRVAIRPRYERLFSRFDPHIEARIDEICVAGGLAIVRGRNGGTLVPRQGGEARPLDDVYLMALRRDEGEGWRITHLIWHPAVPSAPGAPE